jgi:PKD repeat protein
MVLLSEEGPNSYEYQNHMHFYKESSTPEILEIKPVFPSGAETFHAGSVMFIDWISAVPGGTAGSVTLELSVHGPNGPWEPIAMDLPDSGRYQWLIPAGTPSTGEAYIRYTLSADTETVQAITPLALNILGTFNEPVEGLAAANDSPTVLGEAPILTATVISGTNVLYEWDLGDGTLAQGAVISHVYPDLGVYTAVVTASNPVNSEVATTTVEIFEEPVAGLIATNDSPTVLGEWTDLAVTVISGTNVIYAWDLGDGSFATGDLVGHVYPGLGIYTAVVTASNSVSSDVATTTVEVYEEPIYGMVVYNDSPTILGEPTLLSAGVITGTNVLFTWDLGDGTFTQGDLVSHVYPAAGVYTAVVTATNAVSQASIETVVQIEEPISGLIAVNDSPSNLGTHTTMSATVDVGTNVVYEWDLGDGTLATGEVVEHVYPAADEYTAVVTATNAVGWQVAATIVIVEEEPVYFIYLPMVVYTRQE